MEILLPTQVETQIMIGMNDLFMEMQGIDQSINCDENSQIIGVLDSQKQAGKIVQMKEIVEVRDCKKQGSK